MNRKNALFVFQVAVLVLKDTLYGVVFGHLLPLQYPPLVSRRKLIPQ